jgi:hypothetical protein
MTNSKKGPIYGGLVVGAFCGLIWFGLAVFWGGWSIEGALLLAGGVFLFTFSTMLGVAGGSRNDRSR